jgi:nucleotide-binding universal stress UspA family protein
MRILMVIDGSSHAEVTLRLGAQIARRAGEPPTVLMVIKHEADRPPPPANVILSRARELLGADVSNVQTKVRIGCPAEEIIREAQEGDYDLVIVGERQDRNLFSRFLFGSTAVRVAEHAPCPVIVAKGKAGPIHRILLCDSGAESPSVGLCEASPSESEWDRTASPSESEWDRTASPSESEWDRTGPSALSRFTAQLADLLEGEAEITVLHVMSQMSAGPGVIGKQLRADVEELIEEHAPEGGLLERDIRVLERPGIHPRPKVRHGLVVDEILQDAQSGNYDLVVIGAYHGKGWRRLLLDDLAHKIIVRLDRPVLVVR